MKELIEQKPRELAHVRAAIYGQPWAITEPWLETICQIAENHVAGKPVKAAWDDDDDDEDEQEEDLGFDLVNDVAVVPIQGPIFPKANLMTAFSGATALSEVSESLKTALTLSPSAVILNIDSPGGSVMGLVDFCEMLRELAQSNAVPFIALANPLCASAAYMIASQCDMVYATAGAIVGSIGVIGRLDNWDRAQKNMGNDPVILRSSELKAVGSGGPITPNQHADFQRTIMAHFAQFKQAVMLGRPGIDINSVATGQMWMGRSANDDPSAQAMGLIDGISTLENLIEQYGNPNA